VNRADLRARPKKSTRLVGVDPGQGGELGRLPLGLEIGDLPADHAGKPRAARNHRDRLGASLGGSPRRPAGEDLEGEGQQRIAHEDRLGLPKGFVHGGPAAAQVVVVHRGQIVVHEGIGVDHLERGRRGQHAVFRSPEGLAGRDRQQRAQSLASAEHRMPHRLDEAPHGLRGAREQLVDRALDVAAALVEIGREGHGVPAASPSRICKVSMPTARRDRGSRPINTADRRTSPSAVS
jgi:hypothetical protein